MTEVPIPLPQELLDHLEASSLGRIEAHRRVRVALAIHLFLTKQVSIGRAAELAGYPYVEFFHLLPALGFPAVLYDAEELAHDLATLESLRLDEAARPSEDRSGA